MESSKATTKAAGTYALHTQQCRLRHLRSLAARNVQLKKKRAFDVTQLQLYFTLHRDPNTSPFYTSEKIRGSLNPVWKSFSLPHLNDVKCLDTTSQSLTVRVWYGHTYQSDSDYNCCIRWDLHLSGLVYVGSKILNDGSQHAPNTLIFGLHDGFYGAPSEKDPVSLKVLKTFTVEAEPAQIRVSYSTRSLLRLQTVLRAIKQTERGVTRERQQIDSQLLEIENLRRKKAQRELALLKVNSIRSDLERRISQIRVLEGSHETLHKENLHREAVLKKKRDQLVHDSEVLHERKKRYFDVRDELIKTGAQLVIRRKQLLSELAFIYPIQRLPDNEDRICGVHLPHSEGFAGHDETQIAVALGYTCHLVMMISSFLDIPLRYPMDHRGSRSMIRDHIITKLSEKERDFPLFSKGKEKYQFQYGVFILNKNIAQLRHYCGMTTPDLRQTLANISTLLCDRLGIAVNRNDAFSNQHSLIPPSFGGPQKSNQNSTSLNLTQPVEPPKEPLVLLVDQSLRVNQVDPRLEEIEEECAEPHMNTPALNATTVESSEVTENDNFSVVKDETMASSLASEIIELRTKGSISDSNHLTEDEPATFNNLMPTPSHITIHHRTEDFSSLPAKDLPLTDAAGTPCTDEFDASSTEEVESLMYRSHFVPLVPTEGEDLAEQMDGLNNHICDAGVAALLPNQTTLGEDFAAKCDSEHINSTFKTWNLATKDWDKHWDVPEDICSNDTDKFSDSNSLDP